VATFSFAELRHALDHDELLLLYQEQVEMRTGRFAGIECAIRWQHPTMGLLHAVPFVDDVPPSGLAPDFMRFIVRTATRQVARWRERSVAIPRFAINAWPGSIDRELLVDILDATREFGIDVGLIEVETQPEATYDSAMCARLQVFRDAGVRVALDDFGDGDLRFAWLRGAPFDVVKIGVAFAKNAGRPYDDAVTASAVAFARAIGAVTVAEGVETVMIRDRLVELGCDIGQGYLWSRQVVADELPAVIRAIGIDGSDLTRT
jgi:EAL domain-containing protein (putative c-di-GMP-specific phosphodiesterase class I)